MTNPDIDEYGTQRWRNDDGVLHRVDGPAYIGANGYPAWYVNGFYITSIEEYQQVTGLSDEEMTMLVLKYGNVS